jgi:alkaline phosphatase D
MDIVFYKIICTEIKNKSDEMNYKTTFIISLLPLFVLVSSCLKPRISLVYSPTAIEETKVLETIAFGSCNRTDLEQNIWPSIRQTNPDLWIWLGDAIYADTENMEKMKRMYEEQKAVQAYTYFVRTTPIIGTWDDHDYGESDGGKNFKAKAEAQQLFLDFLDVPETAEVRQTEGVYQSYLIGEADKTVKIIVLDTRYFRDDLEKDPSGKARYLLNKEGDILGEKQWQWLENELATSTAAFNIICSSIQVLAEEQLFEKWANFPTARQRLLDLIVKTQPQHPIMISGDRHIGEVAKIKLDGFEQPIYEITSSGLTHAYTKNSATAEPNKYRVGNLINQRHFALLQIDWQTKKITSEIRDVNGNLLQSTDLH